MVHTLCIYVDVCFQVQLDQSGRLHELQPIPCQFGKLPQLKILNPFLSRAQSGYSYIYKRSKTKVGFPLFSSHGIPWLFQYFCHFSLTFFPRLENANYIYLWLQMRLLFQAKTAWRQLKYIKMLCLSPIFTDNEHVFHNVELILNKTMSGNNSF